MFHHKAYEDRLQALEKGLRVIDHLRTHRPKRISRGHGHAHRHSAGIWGTMGFGWGSSIGTDAAGNPANRDQNKPGNRFSKFVGTPMSTLLGTPMFEKAGFNFGGGITEQGTTNFGAQSNTQIVPVPAKAGTRPDLTPASTIPLLRLEEAEFESRSSGHPRQTSNTSSHERTHELEDDKAGDLADSEHGFDMALDASKTEDRARLKPEHKNKRAWLHRIQRHHSPTKSDWGDQRKYFEPGLSKDEDGPVAEAESPLDHPHKPVRTSDHYRHASSDTFHDGGKSKSTSKLLPESKKLDASDDVVFVQAARALKSAVLYDARNLKGKHDDFSGGGWERIGNAREAKVSRTLRIAYPSLPLIYDLQRLARSIYTCFKPLNSHRKYIIPSDFYPAYTHHADAEAAFKVFDKDNNGDISRTEIKSMIWGIYKERRALVRSLRDAGNALRTLDWIMMVLAAIIVFFSKLSLLFLNPYTLTFCN